MQKENVGITCIEPKGDLAEKMWAMGKYLNKPVIYFNPTLPDCPYFNPLFGKEEDVVENMCTTFKMLSPDSSQFFLDQNENLLRNALKVLKRLELAEPSKYNATLINLSRLLQNINDEGRQMVIAFSRLSGTEEMVKENADISAWFLNDYFTGASGGRGATKTYEHTSGVRTQISKLISNKYLRKVLNPPIGRNDIDFDKILAEGGHIAMSSAQGDLRDLAKTLGLFLILQFQSAVFRRPAPEKSRMPHMLYIDEFQEFANKSMGILLTQGRSYRTGCLLATQALAQIALGPDGNSFLSLVKANARSTIVYPGIENSDAEFFSKQFGEMEIMQEKEIRTAKPFDPFNGSFSINRDISRRSEKVIKARYTASDIRYRPFQEISYNIMSRNTLQPPGVGKIEFIPRDVNDTLDRFIDEFREENERIKNEIENKSFTKNIENKLETRYDDIVSDLSNNVDFGKKKKGDEYIDEIFNNDIPDIDSELTGQIDVIDDLAADQGVPIDDVFMDENGVGIYDGGVDDDLFI